MPIKRTKFYTKHKFLNFQSQKTVAQCNVGNEVIFRIEGRDLKAFHAQVWLKDWPYED